MNVWVFLGSLFILVCVCTVVYAICKLVSIVDETRDRTETLARIAVRDRRKVSELDDDLSALAEKFEELNEYLNVTDQTVSEDRAEISALHDHFDDLSNLAEKVSELDDDLSNLAVKVNSDGSEINALEDHFDDLLKRIEKLEKGGAQIERKTGSTSEKG